MKWARVATGHEAWYRGYDPSRQAGAYTHIPALSFTNNLTWNSSYLTSLLPSFPTCTVAIKIIVTIVIIMITVKPGCSKGVSSSYKKNLEHRQHM